MQDKIGGNNVASLGFTVIGIVFILAFLTPVFIYFKRKNKAPNPYKISYGILGLLVLNWLLFLTNAYSFLPSHIANSIFVPVWWVLSAMGLIIGIFEVKNNRSFATSIMCLTVISFMFSMLANGLSHM